MVENNPDAPSPSLSLAAILKPFFQPSCVRFPGGAYPFQCPHELLNVGCLKIAMHRFRETVEAEAVMYVKRREERGASSDCPTKQNGTCEYIFPSSLPAVLCFASHRPPCVPECSVVPCGVVVPRT